MATKKHLKCYRIKTKRSEAPPPGHDPRVRPVVHLAGQQEGVSPEPSLHGRLQRVLKAKQSAANWHPLTHSKVRAAGSILQDTGQLCEATGTGHLSEEHEECLTKGGSVIKDI